MSEKVDLDNIDIQLNNNLNRSLGNKKFFSNKQDKSIVNSYKNVFNGLGKSKQLRFPPKERINTDKSSITSNNANKNIYIDANGQVKVNQIKRCPECKCAIKYESYCKLCEGIDIQIIDDQELESNLNNKAFKNSNKSTNLINNQQLDKMSTTQNITSHIPCNSFYPSKENSSIKSPKSSKHTSLLNISNDEENEEIKYEVDFLYAGTIKLSSRSYFRFDSSKISFKISTVKEHKNMLNIDFKLIKKLCFFHGKSDHAKFVFIKIDFLKEAVDAINDYFDKFAKDLKGVFKYDDCNNKSPIVNGHEKYFLMRLKFLEDIDVRPLRQRLKMYLQNSFSETKEAFDIFDEHSNYVRRHFANHKTPNKKQKLSNNEEICEEMQIDHPPNKLLEIVTNTYNRITRSNPLRSSRQSSIKSLDQDEEMEISEIRPKFQLPIDKIKNSKILYKIPNGNDLIILKTDLFCLNDGNFLNDKIIEFYFNYIKSKLISSKISDKTYIFSSFFFTKMISLTRGQLTEEQFFENQYNLVKNWTKNVDIFSFDYLVIPIFRNYHWSLALICFPGKVLENNLKDDIGILLDGEEEEPIDRPCIIFMDSMGKSTLSNKFSKFLRNFLRQECKNKKNLSIEFNDYEMQTLKPEVPNQLNGYDCGIFVLHYVETFLENPFKVIEQIKTSKSTLKLWFESTSLKDKRKDIFSILFDIYEDNLKDNIKFESDEETTLKSDEEIEILTNSDDKDVMMSDDEDK